MGHRLWPAATFQFALIGGVTQLKSAASALVLSRFESQALPYLYLVGSLITAALTVLPRPKPSSPTESPGVLTVAGCVLGLGLAASLSGGHRTPALLLWLFADTFSTFISLRFWGRMATAFDAREAKRAFTVLNGVGMGGGIVGGLLVQQLAVRMGTIAVVVSGALALLTAGLVFRFFEPEAVEVAPQRSRHPSVSSAPWAYLAQSPYAMVLAALSIAFAVNSSFVDYLFRLRVEGNFSEDGLAALFGSLQLWIGVLCVIFQLFVAGRLLKRLGLLSYLLLVPLVMAPLAATTLVTHALWPVHLLRLVETAVSYSILPVGIQLLYAALPDERREAVRNAVDGLLRKGGTVFAGLLLIFAGRAADGVTMAVAVVALCLALGVLILRIKPAYVEALEAQVGAPVEDAELGGEDQRLLQEALGSSQPERVLRAVEMMSQAELPLREHLPALLSHWNERVQERGVSLALELEARETAPILERIVSEGHRRPRDQAVWALARLAPERAERFLPSLLESPDVGLRCAAIAAMIRTHQGASAALASLESLTARGESAPLAERREVAKLLGRLKDERFAPLLARYLGDADLTVRRVALKAVGESGYLDLAPRLLSSLTWRDERRSAREALVSLGDAVTPLVEQMLNDRAAPLAMRMELPRVLRGIGSPGALRALLFSNVRDDAFLHFRIGAQLSRLRDEHPEHPVDTERVHEALGRRRDTYRQLVEPFRDLHAALGEGSLLTRAVGDRLDQALELSFFLLGLLYPPLVMRRVHQHLVGNDARRRAVSLELFETLVAEEDRTLVMEQVEAHHRELPYGAPGRLAQHLVALNQSEDPVLRACVRYVARQRGVELPPPQEGEMSEATVQKMFALEGVKVFSQSDVDDIAAVAAVAREVSFRAGERIYSQGDPGDALYVIVDGVVDAIRNGEHVLRFQSKDTIGELCLLDGAPRPTDMVAATDSRLLVIDRRDFQDLLADRPELLTGFFRAVSQQLQTVIDLPATRQTGELLEMGEDAKTAASSGEDTTGA